MTARPPAPAFSLHIREGAMAWHVEASTVAELDGHLDQLRVARLVADGLTGQRATDVMRRQLACIVAATNALLDVRPMLADLDRWDQTPWWALDPDEAVQAVAESSTPA